LTRTKTIKPNTCFQSRFLIWHVKTGMISFTKISKRPNVFMFFSVLAIGLAVMAVYLCLRLLVSGALGSSPEILAAAVPISFALLAVMSSVLMIFLPTTIAGSVALAILMVFGVFSFLKLRRENKKLWEANLKDRASKIVSYAVFVIFSLILASLITASFVEHQDGSIYIRKGATVDVPYHLAQVIRIGTVNKWDFEEPNFSGEFIRYPYFVNLVSGLLLKAGAPLNFSFHAPAVLLAASSIFLLVSFFGFLKFGRGLVVLLTLGTLFGSGIGYFAFFDGHGGLPIRQGVPYPMQNIAYAGMIPAFFIVQRTFLLGFPLLLIFLRSLIYGLKNNSFGALVLSAIIVGLLPTSHTHSFIAAMLIVSITVLYLFLTKNRQFFALVRAFVYFAFPLIIPQLAAIMLLPKYPLDSFLKFRLGWMSMPGEVAGINPSSPNASRIYPWLRYMWTNFGTNLLLPFGIILGLRKYLTDITFSVLALGALTLWIVPNLVQFQVWDLDTNKFFAYAIFLSLATCGIMIESLQPKNRKIAIGALALIIIFSLPSTVIPTLNALTHRISGGVNLLDKDERNTAAWLKKNTPDDATILSSSAIFSLESIQNPVVISSGRKATAGFTTWLYTHGIDFSDRNAAIKSFFADPVKNKTALNDMPADYLLLDDIIRKNYSGIEDRLVEGGYQIVYQSGPLALFKLR